MIIEELVEDGARVRHYSDLGMKIRQVETGAVYDDAVDIIPCPYTYAETDIPVPEEDDTEQLASLARILLGENDG